MLNFDKLDDIATPKMLSAYLLVNSLYGNKTRKHSDELAVHHCIDVYKTVLKYTDDEDVHLAAILHDVVEDFPLFQSALIEKYYGKRVYDLVMTLTKPDVMDNETRDQRNTKYWMQVQQCEQASLIKLADTLANITAKDDPVDFKKRYLAEKAESLQFLYSEEGSTLKEKIEEALKKQSLSQIF